MASAPRPVCHSQMQRQIPIVIHSLHCLWTEFDQHLCQCEGHLVPLQPNKCKFCCSMQEQLLVCIVGMAHQFVISPIRHGSNQPRFRLHTFPETICMDFVDAIDQLVQQSRVRKGVFLSRKAAVDACKDSWKSPHFTSARVLRMIRLSSLSTFIAILITRKNLLFVCGALVFVAASDESFVLCGVKKNCHQAAACHSVLR